MPNDDAAPPADRRPIATAPVKGLGPRVLAWALHGPPWTYAALGLAGLLAAVVLACLKG